MKVNITYPSPAKSKLKRHDILRTARWPFLFAAYICPLINLFTGKCAWSIIVLWSLWIVWSLLFSVATVEYNRISQAIKSISDVCILLILIGAFLSPGLAIKVVPIVCFSGLLIVGILFFTDIDKQKQNMMPMLVLCAVSFIAAIVGISIYHGVNSWAIVVMGALSLALPIAACITLGTDSFIDEIQKIFHTR